MFLGKGGQVAGRGFIEKMMLQVFRSPTIFFIELGTLLEKSYRVVNKKEKLPTFMDLSSRRRSEMIT